MTMPMVVFAIGAGAGIVYYVAKKPEYSIKDSLEGQTFVVTGVDSGIGCSTALMLVKNKARIIMGTRDLEKCRKTKQELVKSLSGAQKLHRKNLICKLCELSSLESVRNFADSVIKEEKNVKGLVNCAGVLGQPQKRTVTRQGFEWHLGVNHLGPFLLTMLLAEKLPAPFRIVNVVCDPKGYLNLDDFNSEALYDRDGAYYASNLAKFIFTMHLAKRLEGTGITVNAVDPGLSKTNFERNQPSQRSWIRRNVKTYSHWFTHTNPNVSCGAVVRCAVHPDLDTVTGKYFNTDQKEVEAENTRSNTEDLQKKVFLLSEKWTRLRAIQKQMADPGFSPDMPIEPLFRAAKGP